jgi:hypothetical protein
MYPVFGHEKMNGRIGQTYCLCSFSRSKGAKSSGGNRASAAQQVAKHLLFPIYLRAFGSQLPTPGAGALSTRAL